MKRLFFTLVIAMCSVCIFAQSNISWEGQAGLNISKFDIAGFKSRAGFHIGIRGQMDIPTLSDGIYANAGAFLSLKGASLDIGDLGGGKSNAYYLDIPVHLGYKHVINKDFAVFGEFGPYFAFGLFGKTDSRNLDYNDKQGLFTVYETHDTFDEFKRFDFGLGIRLGAEFRQKYTFSISYDFGLINCWNENWDESDNYDEDINLVDNVKNRNFSITLGYKF